MAVAKELDEVYICETDEDREKIYPYAGQKCVMQDGSVYVCITEGSWLQVASGGGGGGITPSGEITITENGEYNVTNYASASVNVAGGGIEDGSVGHPFFVEAPINIYGGYGWDTAPTNPTDKMLWLDTSVTPNVLKQYDAETQSWVTIS